MFGAGLMLFGATTLAIVYAFITDAIVGARIANVLGRSYRRLHSHVIVCGLGTVGYRTVEDLARRRLPVVAIERQENGRFVGSARRLGVPVHIGDARLSETFLQVNADKARCLIVVTSDDQANLETVLMARAISPNIRVVVRMADTDMASRVERSFGVHVSRSVEALTAPAFAAAAIGHGGVATIKVGNHVLVLAEVEVEKDAQADGRTLDQIAHADQARAICLTHAGQQAWRPAPTTRLEAGDRLLIVATREGITQVWGQTEAGADVLESLQLRSQVRRERKVFGLEI
jgi:Trk K+ transport system NAD-binding subunit